MTVRPELPPGVTVKQDAAGKWVTDYGGGFGVDGYDSREEAIDCTWNAWRHTPDPWVAYADAQATRAEQAEAERDEARAEVARLRDRVLVEASDLAGRVTREHVEAWLAASPDWTRIDDGTHEPGSVWQRRGYPVVCPGWSLLMAVHTIAGDNLGSASSILDEMAAMPLEAKP